MSFGLRLTGAAGNAQIDEKTYSFRLVDEGSLTHYYRFPFSVPNTFDWVLFSVPCAADEFVAVRVPEIGTVYNFFEITPGPLISGGKRFMQRQRPATLGWPAEPLLYRKYKRGAVKDVGWGMNIYGPDGVCAWSTKSQMTAPKALVGVTFPSQNFGVLNVPYSGQALTDYVFPTMYGNTGSTAYYQNPTFFVDTYYFSMSRAGGNLRIRSDQDTVAASNDGISWVVQNTGISQLYNPDLIIAAQNLPGFTPIESFLVFA